MNQETNLFFSFYRFYTTRQTITPSDSPMTAHDHFITWHLLFETENYSHRVQHRASI
jgi:hypothetical protein